MQVNCLWDSDTDNIALETFKNVIINNNDNILIILILNLNNNYCFFFINFLGFNYMRCYGIWNLFLLISIL
jgi:hypothetical protein